MTSAQSEHEWTAQWLRTFLKEKGVPKPNARWDLSDDEALMWLASNIHVLAHIHRNPPTPLTSHPAFAAFPGRLTKAALAGVCNALERRRVRVARQLHVWMLHPVDVPYARTLAERVNENLNQVTEALSVLAELRPTPRRRPTTKGKAWLNFAVPLACGFIQQAKRCGHSFRLAEDGPVVEYVHAVIPIVIKEENPKLPTVASFLKSRAAEIARLCGQSVTRGES